MLKTTFKKDETKLFKYRDYKKFDSTAFHTDFFFYNIINHKQILTKYYNHQEHTYCYLGDYKNKMLEQKLMEQITKIKILKEKRKVKQ